jgi:hypothetical protein
MSVSTLCIIHVIQHVDRFDTKGYGETMMI